MAILDEKNLPPDELLRRALPIYRQNLDAVGAASAGAAQKQQFPCKPGCSWCCHRAAPTSDADVALLVDALRRLSSTAQLRVHEALQRWQVAVEAIPAVPDAEGKPRSFAERYAAAKALGPVGIAQVAPDLPALPCPFLTADQGVGTNPGPGLNGAPDAFQGHGHCAIYADRPLECRLHFAKDEQGRAHGCRSIVAGKPVRLGVLDARRPRQQFYAAGVVTNGLLPLELAEALKIVGA